MGRAALNRSREPFPGGYSYGVPSGAEALVIVLLVPVVAFALALAWVFLVSRAPHQSSIHQSVEAHHRALHALEPGRVLPRRRRWLRR